MSEPTPISPSDMPQGDYAIVEALGHRTLVGKVSEIERFGTKMLQVQPLFGDVMLGPILLGGGSIYQFTPCSAETAYSRRPQHSYQLPPSVLATVPPTALSKPTEPSGGWPPDHIDSDDCACVECLGF